MNKTKKERIEELEELVSKLDQRLLELEVPCEANDYRGRGGKSENPVTVFEDICDVKTGLGEDIAETLENELAVIIPNLRTMSDRCILTDSTNHKHTLFNSEVIKLERAYRTNENFRSIMCQLVENEKRGEYSELKELEGEFAIKKILNLKDSLYKWKLKGFKLYLLITEAAAA